MYIELKTPGVGVGGVVAALAILLFFWSKYLEGTAGSGWEGALNAEFKRSDREGTDVRLTIDPAIQAADMLASHIALSGVLMALLRRERTGKGDYLDIALLDALIAAMPNNYGPPMAERLASAIREGAPLPAHFGLGERRPASSMRTSSSGTAT